MKEFQITGGLNEGKDVAGLEMCECEVYGLIGSSGQGCIKKSLTKVGMLLAASSGRLD